MPFRNAFMHNLDMEPIPSRVSVAQAAERARRLNLRQTDIANALGVSQSQVSRVLSGSTSARSRLAKDVCSYVLSAASRDVRSAVRGNDDLLDALAEVWDGTPAHARALATVIRSLALLTPIRPE